MLAFRTMNAALASIVTALTFSFRSRLALHAEILALRHQLNVLRRSTDARRKLRPSDRVLWVWLSRIWPDWRSALLIVKPETVIHWHRLGLRLYWRWKSRHLGRPDTGGETENSSEKFAFPIPPGERPECIPNFSSWALTYPNRRSPNTWSDLASHLRRLGVRFSKTIILLMRSRISASIFCLPRLLARDRRRQISESHSLRETPTRSCRRDGSAPG